MTPELLRQIADAMERRPNDWWEEFEATYGGETHTIRSEAGFIGALRLGNHIRRKPHTITINGIEVPEPIREAPEMNTPYYLTDASDRHLVIDTSWEGSPIEHSWLNRGLCHLTEDAAKAHARALILASGGTLEDKT